MASNALVAVSVAACIAAHPCKYVVRHLNLPLSKRDVTVISGPVEIKLVLGKLGIVTTSVRRVRRPSISVRSDGRNHVLAERAVAADVRLRGRRV